MNKGLDCARGYSTDIGLVNITSFEVHTTVGSSLPSGPEQSSSSGSPLKLFPWTVTSTLLAFKRSPNFVLSPVDGVVIIALLIHRDTTLLARDATPHPSQEGILPMPTPRSPHVYERP